MNRSGSRLAFAAGVAAACLFGVSLFLPVATAHQTQGLTVIGGLELLFIGPLGALMAQFGWYATPCLAAAVVLLLRRRKMPRHLPVVLAVAKLILLADALAWSDYPNDGGDGPIVAHGPGYALWIAAVLTGAGGLLLARFGKGTT